MHSTLNLDDGQIRTPILSATGAKEAEFYAGYFGNHMNFTDFASNRRYEPFSAPESSADFVKNAISGHRL